MGACAWSAAWCATADAAPLPIAGCAAATALVAVVGAVRRRWAWVVVALVAATVLGVGWARASTLASDPVAVLGREGAVVSAEVTLRGGARSFDARGNRPSAWISGATVRSVEGRGERWRGGTPIEVSVTGENVAAWAALPPGSTVRVTLRLSPPDAGQPLAAQGRARTEPVVVAGPDPGAALVERVRAGLRAASDPFTPDARALVPAIVVGDTSRIPPELVDRFKATGLTHLTAVSGANLVLLLGFVRLAAVWLGARGRVLLGVQIATVFGFVALCLGEPSVVRAAAMGLVGLAALGSGGRGRQGLRYLGVAVWLLVLFDPWLARSLGFALSVGASFGLLWWAGRWTEVLARWLPSWAAEAVAVPLAAQLATQPIVTAISGQVSVSGLVANALAGPLVGPATVLGFLAAGLSLVSIPAATVVAWPAGWCTQGLCWLARLGDALPGSTVPWPADPLGVGWVAACCLLLGRVAEWAFSRRRLCLALAAALIMAMVRTPTPPGWPPPVWTLVSCDVGQGDATVVRAGGEDAIVIDAGPDPRLLARCLDQLGIRRVPLAVLTHLHADHVSGLPALAGRGVRTVVTSGVRTPASGDALVRSLVAGGAIGVVARGGDAWQVGDVRVQVLVAPALATDTSQGEGESAEENDASLLLRIEGAGLSVVLAGDAQETGQERLLGLGQRLDADVLLVPHHGSSSQSEAFLALTTPQVALISVAAKNDYGHPTRKTLERVHRLTPNVYRTDQHGSIAVAREVSGALRVTVQR